MSWWRDPVVPARYDRVACANCGKPTDRFIFKGSQHPWVECADCARGTWGSDTLVLNIPVVTEPTEMIRLPDDFVVRPTPIEDPADWEWRFTQDEWRPSDGYVPLADDAVRAVFHMGHRMLLEGSRPIDQWKEVE